MRLAAVGLALLEGLLLVTPVYPAPAPALHPRDELADRIAQIQAIDKALEMQLRRIDSQRDAVQTEIDAVRKVLGKNIQGSFAGMG